MAEQSRDVTAEYLEAECAAANYDPGEQPDIAAMMRSAFIHGYAQALIDYPEIDAAEGKGMRLEPSSQMEQNKARAGLLDIVTERVVVGHQCPNCGAAPTTPHHEMC
jgi:hypothetical protein